MTGEDRLRAGAADRRRANVLLVLGLLCVVAIFLASLAFRGSLGRYSRDSEQYWSIGVNLAEGNGFTYDGESPTRMRQPVYPLLIAGMTSIFGESVRPIQVLQLCLALLVVVTVVAIVRELFDERTAGIAAIVAGLYYPFPVLATEIRTEVVFFLLVALMALAQLKAVRTRRVGWVVACGIFLGLATLTRAPGAAFVVLVPLATWLVLRKRERAWREPLAVAGIAALLLLPWGIRNQMVLGEFHVLSEAGPAGMYVGVHPLVISEWGDYMKAVEATEEYRELLGDGPYLGEEPARRFEQAVRERFREEPLTVMWRGVVKVVLTWSYAPGSRPLLESRPYAFRLIQVPQTILLVLIIYGTWHACRRAQYLVVALFLGTSAAMFLGTPTARYTLPFMPLGLAMAAHALTMSIRAGEKRRQACG